MRGIRQACLGVLCLLACSGCQAGFNKPVFDKPTLLGEGKEWRFGSVITDFNQDGKPDIISTHRRPLHENSLHIWLGNGSGNFSDLPQVWNSPGYSALGVNDVNADGKPDIIAGSHFNRIHFYRSLPKGNLGEYEAYVLATPDGYVGGNLVDLDGDGKIEAVMLGNEKAGIEVYEIKSDGSLELKQKLREGYIGRDLKILDFNGDGRLDLIVSMAKLGVQIFLQDKNGGFDVGPSTESFVSVTKEFREVAVADFNKDSKLDIALNGGFAGLNKPNGPDVYLANADQSWTPVTENLKIFRGTGEGLAVADFDQDGNLDLVAGGNISRKLNEKAYGLFMFLGDGKGGFRLNKKSGLPEEGMARAYGLLPFDLNQDGLVDLVANHGAPEEGSGYISIWINKAKADGTGTSSLQISPRVKTAPPA